MSRVHDILERQALMLATLVGVATGLVVIMADRPIKGSFVLGGTLVLAGLGRTVVSERHAGFLVNRGRMIDAVTLTVLGLAIIALAASLRQIALDG